MICEQCRRDLPVPNFPLKTGTGDGHEYRSKICRKCDRNNKKSAGLCVCGLKLANGKTSCPRCLQQRKTSVAHRYQQDRKAALKHYGGKCAVCGEDLEIFLTIDHINNDGAEHRRQLRGKNCSGINIGAWLRLHNYPQGFQVLCVNCNHAKGRIGEQELRRVLKEAGRIT